MRVVLVHVLARMAGQLLADLKRNVGIGHRRIEAVSRKRIDKMRRNENENCKAAVGTVSFEAVGLVFLSYHLCRVAELKSHANHFLFLL